MRQDGSKRRMLQVAAARITAAFLAFAVLFSGVFAALAVVAPSAHAEPLQADLRASQQDGYGRIVLTFRDLTLLPEYDAIAPTAFCASASARR